MVPSVVQLRSCMQHSLPCLYDFSSAASCRQQRDPFSVYVLVSFVTKKDCCVLMISRFVLKGKKNAQKQALFEISSILSKMKGSAAHRILKAYPPPSRNKFMGRVLRLFFGGHCLCSGDCGVK